MSDRTLKVFAVMIAIVAAVGCRSQNAASSVAEDAAVATVAEPEPKDLRRDDEEKIKQPAWLETLAELDPVEAIKTVKSNVGFSQRRTDERNLGARTLSVFYFAKRPPTLFEVKVATNETSFGLIKKNSDREIGLRLCVTGTIVQIEESGDTTEGLLSDGNRNLYNFTAYGSSGRLVERSRARLCGYSLGSYDYHNSGGGVGHAAEFVGVWDVPENAPSKPSK